jgi:type IV pilus assembly protein PilM
MAKRTKLGIGLDIGSRSIQLSVLRSSKNGIVLDKAAAKDLPHDAIVEGAVMDSQVVSDTIAGLLKEHHLVGKDVALSVNGRHVMIKRIDTDEMTDDELNSAILYEAKSNLPFDISEVSLDYSRVAQELDTGRMQVLLVAAKNELISDATEPLRWAGGHPAVLEAEPFALQATLHEAGYLESNDPVAALQIGFHATDCTLFAHGEFETNRSLHTGGKTYVEELIRQLGVTFERAASILARAHRTEEEQHALESIARKMADKLADQMERTMPEYFGMGAERHVGRIVLCGGGAHLPLLEAALHEKFGVDVEIANPFRHFEINKQAVDGALAENAPEFATSVGLALRAMGDVHTGFNLLAPSHQKAQQEASHPGSGAVVAALVLSAMILGVALLHISQENRLTELRARLADVKKETDLYRDKIALVDDLTKKRADIAARIEVISDLDRNRFARIRLMQLLNRTLPELTWFTGVQEVATPRGRGVNVTGVTSSNLRVSQFMTSLLQDPDVRGVDLTVSEQTEIAGVSVTRFTLQVGYPLLDAQTTIAAKKPEDQLARGAKAIREQRQTQSDLNQELSH